MFGKSPGKDASSEEEKSRSEDGDASGEESSDEEDEKPKKNEEHHTIKIESGAQNITRDPEPNWEKLQEMRRINRARRRLL